VVGARVGRIWLVDLVQCLVIIVSTRVPFANINSRDKHFLRHGHKFGAVDAAHYERMADAFVFGAMNADTHECNRPNLDVVRMDFVTRHFGVGALPTTVRTFYPIDAFSIAYRGGCPNYFAYQCGRIDL
jgi:pyocin large subunit-like protein